MARVCLIYLGKKHKTLNVLNELGLSWKSAEYNILPEIRSIEPSRKSPILSTTIRFLLNINAHPLSEFKTRQTLVLIMVCQHYKLEF